MKSKNNKINNIQIKTINTIDIAINKKQYNNYGIIIEKSYPKVKTDLHKLFGTKPNHKYF